ncbi:WG repeat-containing protein [uncultured Psychroserpens sp.]|uniref:WG repeat-containing protein n=1 Tax=uncultured Psychroserpens sp. TaxID=255436 RepID=UPI0026316082|nr:WG repeat-containing protein [uncultured Psychroserpens sp.]
MRTTIILFLILVSCLSFGQGNGLYKFRSENGKYGFMDKHGKIQIKAEYLFVNDFDGGICKVSKEINNKNYKWIFINTLGQITSSDKKNFRSANNYSSETKAKVGFTSDTFVPFQKNGLLGFKGDNGRVIIEPKFYKVDKFKNGVCAVRVNQVQFEVAGDYFFNALIDENGKVLIEIEMHCYMGFQGELIEFYGGPHFIGGVYYLNKNGKKINPTQ